MIYLIKTAFVRYLTFSFCLILAFVFLTYCPQSSSGGGLYLNGSWLLWSVNDGLLGLCIMGYYGACKVGYYGVFMVGYYEANVVYGSYE